MTRAIGDIYKDLTSLLAIQTDTKVNIDSSSLVHGQLGADDGHEGDNQKIPSQVLSRMFDIAMTVASRVNTETSDQPYSGNSYIFDTGSYTTSSSQYDAIDEFRKDGFSRSYDGADIQNWLIDENGVKVRKNSISSARLVDGGTDQYVQKVYDLPVIADIADWTKFYDPSIVKIETPTQLNEWLDEMDNVLLYLSSCIPNRVTSTLMPSAFVTYKAAMEMYGFSDDFEEQWYDDLTGESGTIEYQVLVMDSGDYYHETDNLYKEDLTINISDGEGGYTQYTFPRTDPDTGLTDQSTVLEAAEYARDAASELLYDTTLKYSYTEVGLRKEITLNANETIKIENEPSQIVSLVNFDKPIDDSFSGKQYVFKRTYTDGAYLDDIETLEVNSILYNPTTVVKEVDINEGFVTLDIGFPTEQPDAREFFTFTNAGTIYSDTTFGLSVHDVSDD